MPFYRLRLKESTVDAPRPSAMTDADYQKRFNERHPERRAEIREAYDERQREAAKLRKKRLSAWAAPLNVVVSKSW